MASSETIEGSFTGTGESAAIRVGRAWVTVSLRGMVTGNEVDVERSYDQGATWGVVRTYRKSVERIITEPEHDIWYRFNCRVYQGGPVMYRFGMRLV